MAGRVFLGFIPKRNYVRPGYGLNLWGRLGVRPYSTSRKAELIAQDGFENMEIKINFEYFKHNQVKSFEKYRESPVVKELFGGDMEKISKAYEDYCLCKFNKHVQTVYGGNPSTML